MTAQPARKPFRTPTLKRVDRFRARRPDIPISAWHDNLSGKWESQEPGQQEPVQWDSAAAMMDHLEAAYPEEDSPR